IIRSNNAVAQIILNPKSKFSSGFVLIPLDMRNPYGITTLACIITATPGTLWVEYDSNEHAMMLHVLDLIDEDAWRRIIKERYEKRLMEIFESWRHFWPGRSSFPQLYWPSPWSSPATACCGDRGRRTGSLGSTPS